MCSSTTECPICHHDARFDFSSRDLMFNHYERYDYHRCTQCALIFQHPQPSAEQISSFYPDQYDIYDETSRLKKISALRRATLKQYSGYSHLKTTTAYHLLASLLHFFRTPEYTIPFINNGTLLDIGCGNGRFLHGMQQLGWNVKGVEFNQGAVDVCHQSQLDVHHGDLFSANFEDNAFDAIHLSHVIEHVPDPVALFAEVSRILKPNGRFIVKTPNSHALGRSLFDTKWFANEVPRHLYLFSQDNLKVLGNDVGLHITEMRTSTSPKIILNSVDYVINNRGKPSKKIWWRRLLAKPYVWLATRLKRGDEIQVAFQKQV